MTTVIALSYKQSLALLSRQALHLPPASNPGDFASLLKWNGARDSGEDQEIVHLEHEVGGRRESYGDCGSGKGTRRNCGSQLWHLLDRRRCGRACLPRHRYSRARGEIQL